MTAELPSAYDPSTVESRLYAHWRDAGYFKPDADPDRPPFTIVLPPPNVTGRLHMGHALTATIEDCVLRWRRMNGHATLWLPGTDHAGIATQVMVERKLAKEGTTRLEVGREKFLEETWAWKEEHGGIIDKQHEALGASLDWSRYRFTMDEVSSKAVREAFCRLYDEGLIYRAYRLINWDWGSMTALSDLEVEHVERDSSLWHIAYPVEGSDKTLTVATTRPETMLGDTAVAVHPDDPRYKDLIGKHVVLPIVGRKIPIVGDAILVDMHAEATSEKMAMGHWCDGRASVVVGTHTHVPTADHQILPKGTAYQSDAGMTGDYDSVIGMDKQEPIKRFICGLSGRPEPAMGEATICGLLVETDNSTGLAKSAQPLRIGGRLAQIWPEN